MRPLHYEIRQSNENTKCPNTQIDSMFSGLISKIIIADIWTILVVYFYYPPYLTIQGATNQEYKMNTWVYNPYNHPLSSFPSLFMNADIVFEAA